MPLAALGSQAIRSLGETDALHIAAPARPARPRPGVRVSQSHSRNGGEETAAEGAEHRAARGHRNR